MISKRNGEIDFFRFVFSLIIALYHFEVNYDFGYFSQGYIGVEFFFLVSGFLMASHVSRIKNKPQNLDEITCATWSYVIKKIMGFFRYYICVMLLNIILRHVLIMDSSIITVLKNILRSIPTFTLTFMGLNISNVSLYVGNTWYLSALIIAQFILYPMLLKSFDFSSKIIFPLISLFTLGYINNTYGTITRWIEWTGFCYVGVLRAVAEVSLGAALFQLSAILSKKCAEKSFDKWIPAKAFFTAVKIFCYLIVFLYAYGFSIGSNGDLHAMLLCAIGIVLSLSNVGYTIQDGKFTRYLGKISLPIFMFHGFIRHVCKNITGDAILTTKQALMLTLMAVILSVVFMYITDFCADKIKKLFKKCGPAS